ncbi:MAG: hypothetical protein OEV40_13925 [Acidimicrobiia bacterium]|nr:hypothetical protein [Acidimicrobiia bacterium]
MAANTLLRAARPAAANGPASSANATAIARASAGVKFTGGKVRAASIE